MRQGNIGLFKNVESGEYAWLWKVWNADGGNAAFIDMETGDVIPERSVHSSECPEKELKPWMILYEMQPLEAFELIRFDTPDPVAYMKQRSAFEIHKEIANNKTKMSNLLEKHTQMMNAAHEVLERIQNIRKRIEDEQRELAAMNDHWGGFNYIHAKHSATDGQDYCWYADDALAATIHPGDTIIVDTSRGRQLAIVTSIEKAQDYRPHKKVISNLTAHEEETHVGETDTVSETGKDS